MTDRPKLRLLLFNLATDADDPVLGFTTAWLNALAPHCEYIDVITMRVGRLAVAGNVRVFSVGKERGYGEARRVVEFYRILFGLLLRRRYDAGFAHMQQIFALLAAPLLKLWRVPVTLWYAHKATPRSLYWAEKVVDTIVTASPESFRLPSRKVRVIGHGIDTGRFVPAADAPDDLFTLVSVGRIAPVKRLEILIDTMHRLYFELGWGEVRLRVVGEAAPDHAAYARHLRELVTTLDIERLVTFVGPVTHEAVPQEYQQSDVMINLSQTGSVDKAVLEAMACGLPVITANEAFHALLAPWGDLLLIPPESPGKLAVSLVKLRAMPPDERRALGAKLRALVVEQHSLTRLAAVLADLFRERR